MERRTLAHASRVVVISPVMRESLLDTHPALRPETVEVITNGFDTREFAAIEPTRRSKKFVLAYVGSLYQHHREVLAAVCRAWNQLAEQNSDFAENALLSIVGHCDPEIRAELETWPLVDVEILGYQAHKVAIGHMKGASALLLLIRDLDPAVHTITIPGKLFEYVGARRRILMVGPAGDAADIIAGRLGFEHRQDAVDAIGASLQRLYIQTTSSSETMTEADSDVFDRRSLTARLVQVFDKACTIPPQP